MNCRQHKLIMVKAGMCMYKSCSQCNGEPFSRRKELSWLPWLYSLCDTWTMTNSIPGCEIFYSAPFSPFQDDCQLFYYQVQPKQQRTIQRCRHDVVLLALDKDHSLLQESFLHKMVDNRLGRRVRAVLHKQVLYSLLNMFVLLCFVCVFTRKENDSPLHERSA